MGFGLIALGWMFFADIPWEVDLLADFLGCFLIVMGCKRLRPYSGYFGAAANWFSILIVPSVAITALQTAQISGISIEINILTEFSMFYLPKILVLKASARSAPLAKNGYSKHIH